MSWVRNLLISIGAFWLSHELVALFAWLFAQATNGISYYGDSVISAVAMGVMNGMGRAVCAAFGAAIVTALATGAKPERWAWIVALLYVVAARPHYHSIGTPTSWDRWSQSADLLWPAIVCISVATLISRRRSSRLTTRNEGARAVKKALPRRRHWGRLAWIGVTNISACVVWITSLVEIRQAFPSVSLLLSLNAHAVVGVVFAAVGFLLEALNRRVAAFVNCGLWLVVLVRSVDGLSIPLLPPVILVVNCVWYVAELTWRPQAEAETTIRTAEKG